MGLPHVAIARSPVLCVAEDRASCEPGIRLLIASVARHSPSLTIELLYPAANATFREWLIDYPRVKLNQVTLSRPWRGWNVKPDALLALLDMGYDDVLWVDTDIIVTADIAALYPDVGPKALLIAEEALCSLHYDGDAIRARGWGLEVGRSVPFSLNTGVVGATAQHRVLLERWRDAVNSPEFQAAMGQPWDQRPRHFMSDQEVLTALLCSTEFAGIPLRLLRRGTHIVQFFGSAGYTVRERLRNLVGGPATFIHSMGHKIWLDQPRANGIRKRLLTLYQQASPYRAAAQSHRDALGGQTAWLAPAGIEGRVIAALSFGQVALTGMPIAFVNDVVRWIKWARTGGEPRRQ